MKMHYIAQFVNEKHKIAFLVALLCSLYSCKSFKTCACFVGQNLTRIFTCLRKWIENVFSLCMYYVH